MVFSDVAVPGGLVGHSSERGWRLVVAVLFVVLAVAYFAWTWSHELGDLGGDSAIYLLTAQHYSPFAASSPIAAHFAAHSPYPPLYPALLALTGGASSILAAHLATTACLILALWVLYLWQRELGFSVLSAAFVTLLFAVWPTTYLQALLVLSENLFLLCVLLSLWLTAMWQARSCDKCLWLAAVSVAAAMLTRGAGISLLAAFVVFLAVHRPRRYALVALVAIMPPLLWSLVGGSEGTGYLDQLAEKYRNADPVALARQLLYQSQILWQVLAYCCTANAVGPVVMTVAVMAGIVATVWRAIKGALDGLYATFYLGLILVWPFPAEATRLLYVVVPLLFVHTMWLLARLPRGATHRRGLGYGIWYVTLLIALAFPHLVATGQRFLFPLPEEHSSVKKFAAWYAADPRLAIEDALSERLIIDSLRRARERIEPGECVYSIKPAVVAYHLGRISYVPPPEGLSDQAFAAYLVAKNCHYVVALNATSPSYSIPYYPIDRLKGEVDALVIGRSPDAKRTIEIIVGRLRGW